MSALISPMYDWRGRPPRRHDDIRISAFKVAVVLSLLIHAAALITFVPHLKLLTPSDAVEGDAGSPLAVKLVDKQIGPSGSLPQSSPPPAPEPVVPKRAPEHSAPPPTASLRPPARSPVMVAPERTPDAPALPATPQVTPAPQPAVTDLAAYVEARRRERGEAPSQPAASNAPKTDNETDRMNRIIAANIGTNVRPTFGRDPKNGGGVFQIKTVEYDFAEFYFFGWNKDIARNSRQVIEVRKGDNADIRLAVVRKMIGIVREHESGDFLWESNRLGKQLTLSARQKDQSELETFLMKEFYFDTPAAR